MHITHTYTYTLIEQMLKYVQLITAYYGTLLKTESGVEKHFIPFLVKGGGNM